LPVHLRPPPLGGRGDYGDLPRPHRDHQPQISRANSGLLGFRDLFEERIVAVRDVKAHHFDFALHQLGIDFVIVQLIGAGAGSMISKTVVRDDQTAAGLERLRMCSSMGRGCAKW